MPLSRNRLGEISFYALLILAVIALFYHFMEQNTHRIQKQNMIYAEDAARQIAWRIAGQLRSAQDLIDTYAYFLEHTLSKPEITAGMLNEMEANSPFDAIRFTDSSGMNHSAGGQLTPVKDREFYQEGMKGRSGISVIFNSPILNQTIFGFYAPIRYDGKIIGVLHGSYLSANYLRKMLQNSYFGQPSEVFLCKPDGQVVATTSEARYEGNILDDLAKNGFIDEKTKEGAEKIFKNGGEGAFNCSDDCKIDNLCVIYLPGYDFVLVQAFPEIITTTMVENANMAGVQLEIGLFALFASYVAFLLVRSRRQKKRLEQENREFGWVVKGINLLFSSRYCMADLQTGSYDFIVGATPMTNTLPPHGRYDDYVTHNSRDLIGEENQRDFAGFFDISSVRENLASREAITYECHVRRGDDEEWENLIIICLERKDGIPVRVLFLRQNVTEMKLRDLQTKRKLSAMNRKERQYRLAVTSNALCSYEFNVSKDILEDDIKIEVDGSTVSVLSGLGLSAPCAASDFFAALMTRVLPESRDEFSRVTNMKYLAKRFSRGRMEVDIEYWWLNFNNSEMCIRHAFYLTMDDLGGDIMAMGVARDITDQVMAQREATRALQDALLLAQHANEAKTTFLSNMSHDIRTPMNAIIGFATIAAGHLDNREQVRDCLQKVLSSSNHLLSLINDILDMSRIESGKMQIKEQECNISELVHNLVTIIQPQTKAKRMRLFIDTFEVVNEAVIADPLKLNQVFINLLSNAVKYTPAGGNISFRLTQKPAFRHGYADYVFVVSDNGIGMSKDFVQHIFEPFTREATSTQTGIQGTGLGMAITRNIIEMMNGSIEVESEPGKGSTFTVTITLKLQDGAIESSAIDELKGMRTLVVDDDFHACDSVDKMLKKIGLRSEWTTSGKEAVYRAQIAHDDRDPYRTYILDWQMPDMDGLETARQIRRLVGEDAPIIILTAYEWADIEQEARNAGITAFCAKPLFMSDLKYALLSSHKLDRKNEQPQEECEKFLNARILVVDDVEMNREIAEFILAESGFTVETAPDGSDAVEMVRNSAEKYYDAILMDVQMPTMNGYEATRTIRSLPREDVKNMPIIAMTANALEEDKARALKCGMNAHIAKPIDIKNFFVVMRKFFQ